MFDLDQTIKDRHSTRKFLSQPVPQALLDEALALAQHAPSNSNIQPWRLVFAQGVSRDRLQETLLNQAKQQPPYSFGLPEAFQHYRQELYKLGSQSIKFSVKPHEQDTPGSTPTSETYLREAVVKYLSQEGKDATFDFLVQLYVNDEKTPIEDPMQEWEEKDSPFIKLATITVPAQKFDFEERKRLDEGLSFMAWHTLPEHEPLGSVNLARKKVYQEIVNARRKYAQHRIEEPQAYSSILDNPQ